MSRLVGLLFALLGVAMFGYVALATWVPDPRWEAQMIALGMPLSYLMALGGALLAGAGLWMLLRRRA
jgi:hypothetical protein